jgi:hypothetical protein
LTAATRDRLVFVVSLLTGAGLWIGVGLWAGTREAWDSPRYGTVALPAAYALLALLGYVASRAAWRWPLLLFGGQLVAALARGGARGSLLPLGVAALVFLAVLGLLPTYLGVGLRRMRQRFRAARLAAAQRRAAGF